MEKVGEGTMSWPRSDTCYCGSESIWPDLVTGAQITAGEAETCI